MNEMRLPEVPPPQPPPLEPVQPQSEGSLALGVGLAWAINVGGGMMIVGIAILLMSRMHSDALPFYVFGSLPLLTSVALAIWMIVKGPRRTGIGILIGIGTIWAVQLLLMAACFGLLFAIAGGGH